MRVICKTIESTSKQHWYKVVPAVSTRSLAIRPVLCLLRLQMAGIRLGSETPKPAGPYDMINTGNTFSSPFHCHSWRVRGVYSVSLKEAQRLCNKFNLSNLNKASGKLWLNQKPALNHNKSASFPYQESGRETPSTNQASSINGTDDEKISHVSPEAAVLKSENERLKSAVEQR